MRSLLEIQIQKESTLKYEAKFQHKTALDEDSFSSKELSIQESPIKSLSPVHNYENSVSEERHVKASENYHFFQTHEIESKDQKKPKVDKALKRELDNIVKNAEQCNN